MSQLFRCLGFHENPFLYIFNFPVIAVFPPLIAALSRSWLKTRRQIGSSSQEKWQKNSDENIFGQKSVMLGKIDYNFMKMSAGEYLLIFCLSGTTWTHSLICRRATFLTTFTQKRTNWSEFHAGSVNVVPILGWVLDDWQLPPLARLDIQKMWHSCKI